MQLYTVTDDDNIFSNNMPDVLYGQTLLQPVYDYDMVINDIGAANDYNTLELGGFSQSTNVSSVQKINFKFGYIPATSINDRNLSNNINNGI